jgi:hypothetical protein
MRNHDSEGSSYSRRAFLEGAGKLAAVGFVTGLSGCTVNIGEGGIDRPVFSAALDGGGTTLDTERIVEALDLRELEHFHLKPFDVRVYSDHGELLDGRAIRQYYPTFLRACLETETSDPAQRRQLAHIQANARKLGLYQDVPVSVFIAPDVNRCMAEVPGYEVDPVRLKPPRPDGKYPPGVPPGEWDCSPGRAGFTLPAAHEGTARSFIIGLDYYDYAGVVRRNVGGADVRVTDLGLRQVAFMHEMGHVMVGLGQPGNRLNQYDADAEEATVRAVTNTFARLLTARPSHTG